MSAAIAFIFKNTQIKSQKHSYLFLFLLLFTTKLIQFTLGKLLLTIIAANQGSTYKPSWPVITNFCSSKLVLLLHFPADCWFHKYTCSGILCDSHYICYSQRPQSKNPGFSFCRVAILEFASKIYVGLLVHGLYVVTHTSHHISLLLQTYCSLVHIWVYILWSFKSKSSQINLKIGIDSFAGGVQKRGKRQQNRQQTYKSSFIFKMGKGMERPILHV